MNDILEQIAANKRIEVDSEFRNSTVKDLESVAHSTVDETVHSFRELLDGAKLNDKPAIIAEFKRRSPSKGDIAPMADVSKQIPLYAQGGASCCSILTDTRFFGGSTTDFSVARQLTFLPLLRKDFIIDERQIYQSRIIGANVILLIASILNDNELSRFTNISHSLGMEVLYEIHYLDELNKMPHDVDFIGINNRNLSSFNTDVKKSEQLVQYLPKEKHLIAESGISDALELRKLRELGFTGFLIGESLMRSHDAEKTLMEFLSNG